MSVKERPEKNKEEVEQPQKKPSTDDWLDTYEEKPKEKVSQKPEVVVKPEQKVVTEVDTRLQEFMATMPTWIKKPFMYVQPTHVNLLGSWLESWENLILEYTQIFNIHVINVNELRSIFPFDNVENKKQLTKKQLEFIFTKMEERGVARWLDDNHIIVRVYYKTINQWKDIIFTYLKDSGQVVEVLTIEEFEKMEMAWSSLPREDLQEIFEILIQEGHARWVGENRDTIAFNMYS
jgi:hypothetical protein